MRLLFDGFWWVEGPTANRAVMTEIVRAWRRAFPQDEMLLAVRARDAKRAVVPAAVTPLSTRLGPQAICNALELPVLARRHHADAIITHNFAPLSGRSLVFIHDLLFEEHPDWFTSSERLYFAAMAPLARRASVVATSSQNEAERIERLHPRLSPVLPVGLAVSTDIANSSPRRPDAMSDVQQFILSVGRLNKRKNLGTLIEGAMATTSVTPDRPLVVVGSSEYSGSGPDIPSTVQAHVQSGRLVFLGRIPDGELRWLYEHADCLVFLSLGEGFGLPPAEAIHFGTPVIASDIPVMREVVGDVATLVSPHSATELARALETLEGTRAGGDRPPLPVETQWEEIVTNLRDGLVAAGTARKHRP